jgi:sortase family protein
MRKHIKKIIVILIILFICLIGFYVSQSIKEKNINNQLKVIASESKSFKEKISESEIIKETESETKNEVIPETTNIDEEVYESESINETVETKEVQSLEVNDNAEKISIPSFSKEVNFQNLHNENNDYLFWLYIPNSNIDYPVMMSKDNKDYLHSSFYKENLYAGTLFIDALSSKKENQENLIIYGHNMRDGSMFGTVKKWKNKKYFDSHKFIEIYTEKEKRIYYVFAVREVSSNMSLLHYKLDGFTNNEYIQDAKNKNVQFREIEEQYKNNQILTLSTCMSNDAKRLILNAILVSTTKL